MKGYFHLYDIYEFRSHVHTIEYISKSFYVLLCFTQRGCSSVIFMLSVGSAYVLAPLFGDVSFSYEEKSLSINEFFV